MKQFKITHHSIFYVYFKKHFCPECSAKLEIIKVKKNVNSKSSEAKEYDFSFGVDAWLCGDVEFSWSEFKCPECSLQIKIKDMKKYEKEKRKNIKK